MWMISAAQVSSAVRMWVAVFSVCSRWGSESRIESVSVDGTEDGRRGDAPVLRTACGRKQNTYSCDERPRM